MDRIASPIADLSYRNYDGPLVEVSLRWWVIAKSLMRTAIKNRWFWVWAVFSAYGYLILSVVFYVMDTLQDTASQIGQEPMNLMNQVVWKEQVFVGFSLAQFFLFIVTLIIGSGAIAADNRANALLVYLSKPCTKFDYLFGKWLGMALLLFAITAIPAVLFIGFTWMSYREFGVWDSLLLPKVLLITAVPAILYSSVMIGLSALTNQARIAGAAYAGIYFIGSLVAQMFDGMRLHVQNVPIFEQLSYISLAGIVNGLAKVVLDTSGTVPFMINRRGNMPTEALGPPPNGLVFTFILFGLSALFLFVAWRKIRAVEVVG